MYAQLPQTAESRWLDLLVAGGSVADSRLDALRRETRELIAMLVASINTASRSVTGRKR
jgi:hypothetical protein